MTILLIFILLICMAIILAVGFFVVSQFIAIFTTDAPFVPIPDGIDEEIIKHLKLSNGNVLYDLGCGDGRILRYAVSKNPNIKAVGVDMAFFPYFLAKFYTRKMPNVKIRREDIFETDVRDASHIFLYLFPQVLDKLIPILKQKCKPGTRIVSCDFECAKETPTEIIKMDGENRKRGKRLIVYTV